MCPPIQPHGRYVKWPSDHTPGWVGTDEGPQSPFGSSHSQSELAFREWRPRRGEANGEARLPNVERERLQRPGGRGTDGLSADSAGLEDGGGERPGDGKGAQHALQGGAEVAFGESQDLAQYLTRARPIVRFDDGETRTRRQGPKRGFPGHVLGAPEGELRPELY